MLRSIAVLSLLALSAGAAAQDIDESALDALDKTNAAVVAPVREPAGAAELRAAMRRISYNSSDADALADAGNASLALGDANAALNFFTRANVIRPSNGRIVAGLATATVRTENPFEALRLFDDAVRLGISDRAIAADRALAFDLLGNFARAQQDYRLARTAAISDDLVIRQAISLSLAGQKTDSDAMLVSLLQQNNAAAWRARAFMLAARGDFRESTKVTQGFMDAGSAQRMERYLRLMPDLTAAQQAAAIHLGHFPASQYVGRDSDQLRRVASTIAPVAPSPGKSRLIPAGAPLGPTPGKKIAVRVGKRLAGIDEGKPIDTDKSKNPVANSATAAKSPKTAPAGPRLETAPPKVEQAQNDRALRVEPAGLPVNESARPLISAGLPPQPQPILPQYAAPQISPAPRDGTVISASPMAVETAPMAPVIFVPPVSLPTVVASGAPEITVTTAVALQSPTPSGSPIAPLVAPSAEAVAATGPIIVAPIAQAAPSPAFDLASIVNAIEIPESEQKPSAVPVDLKKIKAAASKTAAADVAAKAVKVDPKIAAKIKAEAANPARFWVQIATGEASALGYDYGKWTKKSTGLFKAQSGWTSAWGKTSRLLVGPFADMKAAKKWEGDFKKAGGNGFMWKSENGVAVTALKSK